jgi:hypothetical protein
MTNITGIRDGIETNLETITGLRGYSEIPENPSIPAAVVVLNNVNYDQAFQRGLTEMTFTVTVIVGRFNSRSTQQRLNDYASGSGDSSIKTAIQSDHTLGGNAVDVRVEQMTNIGAIDLNDGNNYLGMDFSVTVYAE